uniref:Cation/H+ exchanger transmembrane domain-containing protein n=1 Tax=Salix viminalis TaxID=40686 RepID=A0A6N2MJ12_SALVM
MGSVTAEEGVLLYRISEWAASSSSSAALDEWNPTDTVIFFGLSLGLGIACRHVLRGTRVPYTVALLVIGIALGSLEYGTSHELGRIGDGIRLWAHIDPDLLLAIFLPALLFESSFSMEIHQIKRCMAQMLLLAVPGVLISTCCLGCALKLIFPYNWSWTTSLLLGGLLSATDPVAVVALLKELGASKKLSTIIEGESLMNDGTAIVVYQLLYRMVLGESFNWGSIVKFLTQVSLGAVGIGIAFGIASVLWLGFIFNDTVIEIALTVAVSYIAYFTAQEGAGVSGVLAVMTLGMFYAAAARTAFKGDGQQSLHHFWEMVAYIANTLIFILSGVVIAEGVLSSGNIFHNHGHAWSYLFFLYFLVQLSRFVVVGILYPFLQYFGYGLDWKEATILIWSGLRGAVALSLSLSVKASNAPVTPQFISVLKREPWVSATKKRILNYTRYEMLTRAKKAFRDLGDDEELGPCDWLTVKTYIASLNNLEGSCEHPHSASEADNLDPNNLKDIRIRLLNGVQAAYWGMLNEGRIMQKTANILMQSVDEAIDLASQERLCDWKGLQSIVHFPSYYKLLQASIFPQKMVTYFTVERLESACYICAAFLRAHKIARRQLHDFIGGSDIASIVINESKAEGEEARNFLEGVRVTFPQVLRVVKTRQVTYSVLNHLIDYVQNLEKVGLLEEKEMLHLHDSVQTDLKRLLRNPPLVNVPTITDLISVHPLPGALPSMVREALEGSMNEMMKPCGVPLYKEGSNPNGIWLISSGVVKESAIVLAKLLLPRVFENMSTHELRVLVAERSEITVYMTGETIEVPHHSIGFLLEGFIKAHGSQEESIASPAVLLPLQGDQSSQNMEISGSHAASFSHQGSQYQVPARARVIFIDIAAFEVNGALRRRSPSLPSLLNRPLTREHGGLMSWPENFYRPGECEPNFEGTYRPSNSLSARAMQLGIFGSMVCSINIYLQRYVPKHLLGALLVKIRMSGIFILINHSGNHLMQFIVDVPRRDHSFPASKVDDMLFDPFCIYSCLDSYHSIICNALLIILFTHSVSRIVSWLPKSCKANHDFRIDQQDTRELSTLTLNFCQNSTLWFVGSPRTKDRIHREPIRGGEKNASLKHVFVDADVAAASLTRRKTLSMKCKMQRSATDIS